MWVLRFCLLASDIGGAPQAARPGRAELLAAAQVQDRTGSVLELRAYSAAR